MKPPILLTWKSLLPFVGIVGLLNGCGGGGGSRDAVSIPFTSWSDVNPPATVFANGVSEDADYVAPAPDYTVTELTDLGFSTDANASITYREDMTISRISITTPNGTVTWNESSGDLIDDTNPLAVRAVNSAETSFAIAVNPLPVGWDYQTFGAWQTGRGTGAGTFGAISVGAPTAGTAIPTTNNATFVGATLGAYVDADGRDNLTAGDLKINADFGDRSLGFASTGTEIIDPVTGSSSLEPGLDMSGTLTYEAGINAFSGSLASPGRTVGEDVVVSPMTGQTQGRFYGPNAEELGGVFAIKAAGEGAETYAGSYGAARAAP